MGGRVATPFGGWYYASKYAVEGLSDALRMEAKEFGIDVILVEPGLVKSEWSEIAAKRLKETISGSAYEKKAYEYSENLSIIGYCAKFCVYLLEYNFSRHKG